jgi:hypothetical protein
MLRIAIERCPQDMWADRDHPRAFWRIAYHTLFYTHIYLGKSDAEFVPWKKHQGPNPSLAMEPWEPGAGPSPYTKEEILSYCQQCDDMVDRSIDTMDLDAENCGIPWYDMPKLDHQLVNIRHIQQHAGQLSELLMAAGIDTEWVGGSRPKVASISSEN